MYESIEETCAVTCVENGRSVIADLLSFVPQKFISVSIDRKVKLKLNWNGMVFEGRMGKLTFTTNGPSMRTVAIKG